MNCRSGLFALPVFLRYILAVILLCFPVCFLHSLHDGVHIFFIHLTAGPHGSDIRHHIPGLTGSPASVAFIGPEDKGGIVIKQDIFIDIKGFGKGKIGIPFLGSLAPSS